MRMSDKELSACLRKLALSIEEDRPVFAAMLRGLSTLTSCPERGGLVSDAEDMITTFYAAGDVMRLWPDETDGSGGIK